jgi:hypothetical protein
VQRRYEDESTVIKEAAALAAQEHAAAVAIRYRK